MFAVKKYYFNMIYRLSTLNESLLHCFFHGSKLTQQTLQNIMNMKFARQGFLPYIGATPGLIKILYFARYSRAQVKQGRAQFH